MRILIPHAKKILLYIVVFFFLCTPPFFDYIGSSAIAYGLDVGTIIVYIWITGKWFQKGRVSTIMALTLLLFGIIIVSTVINGRELVSALRYSLRYLIVIMLVSNEKRDFDFLFCGGMVYLAICSIINIVTILLFPKGMNDLFSFGGQPAWFLSNKNGLGKILLALLFFAANHDYKSCGHLTFSFFIIAAVSIASVILIWSAASIVAICLMIVIVVCLPSIRKYRPRLFNIYYTIAGIAILFLMFVIIQNAGFFAGFIRTVLKKSLTFNGRTPIWSEAVNKILDKPILGYGFLKNREFVELIGIRAASDAHNYLLTLGIYGGILTAAIFVSIILIVAKRIRKIQYHNEGIVLTAYLFALLLLLVFENTSSSLHWIILSYATYIKMPASKYDKKKLSPLLINY